MLVTWQGSVISERWCSNENPGETKSDGNCRPNREGCRLEVGWYYIPGFYCLLDDIRDLLFVTSICPGFQYRQFIAKKIYIALLKGPFTAFVKSKWVISLKWNFGKIDAKSYTFYWVSTICLSSSLSSELTGREVCPMWLVFLPWRVSRTRSWIEKGSFVVRWSSD